jgi:hypothetical protein
VFWQGRAEGTLKNALLAGLVGTPLNRLELPVSKEFGAFWNYLEKLFGKFFAATSNNFIRSQS